MATPEQLLRKLDERFVLGEISDEQYQQLRPRLLEQAREASADATLRPAATEGDAPAAHSEPGAAHSSAGAMSVADSVIKGNVTSGSASVGNININVGQQSGGGALNAELEYERFVVLAIRSGGSLEIVRKELDDCRTSLGLTIRLAREIEQACLASCARVQSIPSAPHAPEAVKRLLKSASSSLAAMFGGTRQGFAPAGPPQRQPGPPPHQPAPPQRQPAPYQAAAPPRGFAAPPPPPPQLPPLPRIRQSDAPPPPPVHPPATPPPLPPASMSEAFRRQLRAELNEGPPIELDGSPEEPRPAPEPAPAPASQSISDAAPAASPRVPDELPGA